LRSSNGTADNFGMRTVVFAVLVAASACTQTTPVQQAPEIARDLCNCAEPGDDTCPAAAEAAFGSAGPTQACIDCVQADVHACAAMVEDCVNQCISQGTTGGQ